MAALRPLTVALALSVATPAQAQAPGPIPPQSVAAWRLHIVEASTRFGVPVAWIERVMQAESGGRTTLAGRPIVSRAGAMGLMQLMPATWAELRAALGLGDDPHDPRDNILAGTAYLRMMYDRFGYPGLFAAYNAGPARYAEYLAGRRLLPGETRAYLVAVAGGGRTPSSRGSTRQPSALFVTLTNASDVAGQRASPDGAAAPVEGLFVPLSAAAADPMPRSRSP